MAYTQSQWDIVKHSKYPNTDNPTVTIENLRREDPAELQRLAREYGGPSRAVETKPIEERKPQWLPELMQRYYSHWDYAPLRQQAIQPVTSTSPTTENNSNVISREVLDRARNKDYNALNEAYGNALKSGSAYDFARQEAPQWARADIVNWAWFSPSETSAINRYSQNKPHYFDNSNVPKDANVSVIGGYNPVAQLASLRAIDPEKYGGDVVQPPKYIDLDTGSMSIGELAAAAYKNSLMRDAYNKQKDKESAIKIAQIQKAPTEEDVYKRALNEALTDKTREEINQMRLKSLDAAERAHLNKIITDTSGKYTEEQVKMAKDRLKYLETKSLEEKKQLAYAQALARYAAETGDFSNIPVEGYAIGGEVKQYGQPPQLNPLMAEYGQYLQAAFNAKVPPVPFSQYVTLVSSVRDKMQQIPFGYAKGGEIDVSGRQVIGPGTETSDSIPAVIDGKRVAALSTGEYVIPAHVVRAKGTEFFDKLISQYSDTKD